MGDTTKKPETVEEFDALLLEMNTKRDALNDQIRAVRKLRDAKAAEASLDKKLAAMPKAELEALAQRIAGAGDVPSSAVVKGLVG